MAQPRAATTGRRAAEPRLSRGVALELLATMWLIRCFEERVSRLVRNRQLPGLVHLSIGGEGVAAGVCRQLRDDDAVYTGHRGHGHALAKGAPLDRTLAELLGASAGLCRGLGGSMHLVDVEHGLLGATGVVGGNLPLAVGDALAAKLDSGSDRVTVVFFGDGAVQAGHFHESVNLASLWDLPLIFVCENNGMAEFTSRSEHTRVESVSDVVAPYGFGRRTVDGSDVEAVWSAFGSQLAGARERRGPFLLECLTHRRRGHYEGDQEGYRDALADAAWARLDPLARLEALARKRRWLTAEGARRLTASAEAEVERALESARASAPLSPDEAAAFVYAR